MALSLVVTRDAITDTPTTFTLVVTQAVVGKVYTLTVNGIRILSATANSTTLRATIIVSSLPAAVQASLASLCSLGSDETIVPSELGGCANDMGATTIRIS